MNTRSLISTSALSVVILLMAGCRSGGRDGHGAPLVTSAVPSTESAAPSAASAKPEVAPDASIVEPLVTSAAAAGAYGRPFVRGRILAGEDPVENAYVYYYPGGNGQQYTSGTGEYQFVFPCAGTFEVCAAPPSGRRTAPAEFMVPMAEGEQRELDIQLGRCGFSGMVREATSSEVLGDVAVNVFGTDENGRGISAVARTDDEGRFRIQPLLPGTYSLEVAGRIYASPLTEPIKLVEGERRTDIDLRASPERAEVRVNVEFGTREDLRNSLSLELVGSSNDLTRADPRGGSCLFEALRPGTYTVRLKHLPESLEDLDSTNSLVERMVEVKAGESRVLAVDVPEDA